MAGVAVGRAEHSLVAVAGLRATPTTPQAPATDAGASAFHEANTGRAAPRTTTAGFFFPLPPLARCGCVRASVVRCVVAWMAASPTTGYPPRRPNRVRD